MRRLKLSNVRQGDEMMGEKLILLLVNPLAKNKDPTYNRLSSELGYRGGTRQRNEIRIRRACSRSQSCISILMARKKKEKEKALNSIDCLPFPTTRVSVAFGSYTLFNLGIHQQELCTHISPNE